MFIIDDDCATTDGGPGRRGLCGSLFLFKVLSNLIVSYVRRIRIP